MKKFLALCMILGLSSALAKDCVDCSPKEVEGMPGSRSFSPLEKIAAAVGPTQDDYIDKYCLKFTQTPNNLVGSLIKELEKSPYPADDYFLHNKCKTEGYSSAVTSPMIHAVADAPESRSDFLNNIWLYYSKKRKEPEIFLKIINMQNTKGETILDYIESLRLKGRNTSPAMQGPVQKLVSFICEAGGVYNSYKNKSCSK